VIAGWSVFSRVLSRVICAPGRGRRILVESSVCTLYPTQTSFLFVLLLSFESKYMSLLHNLQKVIKLSVLHFFWLRSEILQFEY
jgi:hypothetical protein